MRLRNPLRQLLLFAGCILLLWSSAVSLRAQTFNLQTGREPITSLNGLWRFHTGDNPQWSSPNFDDSQWPLLRSDKPWTVQGYPGYGGFAWYRFTVQVPDGSKPLSLLLPPFINGYRLYANGKWIGRAGSPSPTHDPSGAYPEAFRLPAGDLGPETIHIALRVWSYQPLVIFFGGGPQESGSVMGDSALLEHRLQQNRDAQALTYVNSYAYSLLAALVGLTILGLFLFRREDREYLWFSVLLLAGAAHAILSILGGRNSLPILLNFLLKDVTIAVSMAAALGFFSIVLGVRRSFWWWLACIAAAASPLTDVGFYLKWPGIGITDAIQLCCLLPAYVWIVVTLAIYALRKNTSARLLLVPAALLYIVNVSDSILYITWELGWQRKLLTFVFPLLSHPFPLYARDLINYIFILALLIFLVLRFSLARQEETRLATEMEAARRVQSFLVPATAPNPPGFTVESVYLPASEVGGDFFQVQPGDDGSLLIVVGDVSGKGLKAAMTVSTIIGALRDYPSGQPANILAHLNRVLHGRITGFATCCATLISADGAMTIANAGHLSPYRNGEELAVAGGLPLGIVAEAAYDEEQYQLAPGDRLTFLSDGVIEARNQEGDLYGFERAQQISNQPAATIAKAAKNFGQEDDITVLSVEYVGAAATVHA